MNTEITDNVKHNGWVCYDADCGFCVTLAGQFRGILANRRFELVPLQAQWVRERLGLDDVALPAEMRLLKPDGETLGGADALLEIGRAFWWAWPLRQLGRVPAVMKLFRAGYQWVAQQRSCAGGACEITPRLKNSFSERGCVEDQPQHSLQSESHRNHPGAAAGPTDTAALRRSLKAHAGHHTLAGLHKFDFLPLALLPIIALLCQTHLAPWIFMWAMAFALYGGCKWLTYRLAGERPSRAQQRTSLEAVGNWRMPPGISPLLRPRTAALHDKAPTPSWSLTLGYLLAWPGMNAVEFFNRDGRVAKTPGTEWAFAVAKIIFGSILLWVAARAALPVHPLLAGWVGMIGVVFILHFGLFHLLSLAWRREGINAEPVMQNPLLAKSLADFWGARWNTAFNELAFRFTFRPLRRLTTPAVATLAVFGLSGIIHELVISLPARGGYGLPTLYFLAQGLGVIAERSRLGRKLGLGHGWRGWIFTLLVTAGPVFWLFHPPFINHVILPMLTAIGAT